MKRILYIGAGNPWRGGAGYLVRQSLLLAALTEVADLHLAMFHYDPQFPSPHPHQLTPLPAPTHTPEIKWTMLAKDLLSPEPRMIRGYDLRASRAAVAALHPENFDAVFAFRIDFAHWAGVLNHPRLILDIDDPEHLRAARRIQATTGAKPDWRTQRDLNKLRQFEHNAVANAQLSLVCHEADRHGWPKEPAVVPNCVEVPPNPPRNVQDPRLIFVGNCAADPTTPNVDAILYFLRDIWPTIIKSVPRAQFQIIGAAGDAVRQAAAAANVQVSGFVESLAAAYATASAAIAPIRFGTGTRVKIIEAFAHACPVVSTIMGAEGIETTPNQNIALANTPDDFAQHCITMLTDPATRERIGAAGYAIASQHYDRRLQQQRLAKLLQNQINTRTDAPKAAPCA